jgi:spermidine/putrescine transport system permease protein
MNTIGISASGGSQARRAPGLMGWLLLMPMVLWLVAFVVIPTLILLVYSFCERGSFGEAVFSFTWENYGRAFDARYLKILMMSVWYAALTTAFCVLVGYPVAWFIARARPALRSKLLLLVMLPFWISFLLRTYAWISLLKAEGVVSAFLQSARVITEPLSILYTPTAVIIGLVYAYLPFMILPIYSSAEKLDESVIEASQDLGAGAIRTFFRVILPLTWPGVSAGVLLTFVPAIGMFAITDLMGGARVPMVGNVIQQQFGAARNWPFGAALGICFLFIFVAVYSVLRERESKA